MFEWILGHGHAHALLLLFKLLKCLHLGTRLFLCSHICLNQNNVSQIQIRSTAPIGLLPASPRFPARTVAILSLLLLLNSSPTQHCLAVSQHILLPGSSCLEPRVHVRNSCLSSCISYVRSQRPQGPHHILRPYSQEVSGTV